jgi:hypothetical protein
MRKSERWHVALFDDEQKVIEFLEDKHLTPECVKVARDYPIFYIFWRGQ